MQLPLLNAVIAVRSGLRRAGNCCHDYTIPNEVLQKIKTNETYQAQTEEQDLPETEIDINFLITV